MSNPILKGEIALGSFASVVATLPPLRGARDQAGVQRQIEELKAAAREEAKEEGYGEGQAAGWSEGLIAGRDAGRREALLQAAEDAARREAELAEELAQVHARIEAGWAEFIVEAEAQMTARVMDAVRAVVAAELEISRSGAHAIVARCLEEVTHAKSVRVRVDARDLPGLGELLAGSHPELAVELVADEAIGAGCVVESASGRVDGRVATTLRLLENAYDEAA